MTVALEVGVEVRDGVAFVAAAGEIDLSNADRLSAALGSPACERSAGVVVDLRAVSFMDSSGLAAILNCARELDSPMAIAVDAGSPVARLLDLASIDSQVPTFGDLAEADAAVRGTAEFAR